ncbi:hypothetical protein [Lentzea sp. NPDC003310]|uniref:hypothetical protein n=1 Tax=Lentzea sp. NPDC003310 TaxID=3154447 RepID=UPI0033B4B9A2
MSGSLYDHALALHAQFPDGPLPGGGAPYPDQERHVRRHAPSDRRVRGREVAAALDDHFASPTSLVEDFADTLATLDVPIHYNEHIAAAALRADSDRVRRVGRELVRHGHDRSAVVVGLALLATDNDDRDIPLIRTIGLLSYYFAPLAAKALERRSGGAEALTWLGDRCAGWGRVYVVEALCDMMSARSWLLRHACDGDYLNGYFAYRVATAAHLHAALNCEDVDEQLIDHTGLLLNVLTDSGGMALGLWDYPAAAPVVEAYTRHVTRLPATEARTRHRTHLAEALRKRPLPGVDTSATVTALLG